MDQKHFHESARCKETRPGQQIERNVRQTRFMSRTVCFCVCAHWNMVISNELLQGF